MRIDKLLWFLRLTKTRTIAQAMTESGHVRLNGQRVERCSHKVSRGDVLTLPLACGVCVITVTTLPERRGPAKEAQTCYQVLDEGQAIPIAAVENTQAARRNLQP